MCRAKSCLWPSIAHLLTMSLHSLLRHFTPPTNANYAQSMLFAKANIGFRSMPGFHAFIVNAISMINARYKGKVRFQQSNKYALLRANKQHSYIWEPHCGYSLYNQL